jgi:hypothetical protein
VAQIAQSAGWLGLSDAAIVAFAVGVGSLSGSRALTLTAVIGRRRSAPGGPAPRMPERLIVSRVPG